MVRLIVAGVVGIIALLAGIALGSLIRRGDGGIVIQTVVAPQTVEVPVTRQVEIEVTRRVIETFVVKETVEVTTQPQVTIQVVTATPDPATSTPELPTVTPLPSATATATPVPLTLPFIDSFDSGRPEWKSITGDSSRVQGKLNIVKGPLKLELPSAGDLKDYTVSFDYSYASYAHIEVYFGSKFRFVFDSHFGGIGCSLQVLTDNNWATPAELPCSRTGNFSIKLSGDDYVLLASNQEIGRANFAVDASRQPISLYVTNEGGTTIDNFTVTAP